MKRTSISVVVLTMAFSSAAVADPIWIETFDTGVGRFDDTLVDGDSLFVWDGANQRIHGHYRRDGQAHRRYADLGRTFNADDTLGFSAVVTPGVRNQDWFANVRADFGFYNSSLPPEEVNNRVGLHVNADRDDYGNFGIFGLGNVPQDGPNIRWYANHTYFLEFLYEGDRDSITWSVFEGVDSSGVHLGTRHNDLTGLPFTLDVDRLGMGSAGIGLLPGQNYAAWVYTDIDNFAFTVPEPSTALMLVTGLLLLRGRN